MAKVVSTKARAPLKKADPQPVFLRARKREKPKSPAPPRKARVVPPGWLPCVGRAGRCSAAESWPDLRRGDVRCGVSSSFGLSGPCEKRRKCHDLAICCDSLTTLRVWPTWAMVKDINLAELCCQNIAIMWPPTVIPTQQEQQLSPRIALRPSITRMGSAANAATESIQRM